MKKIALSLSLCLTFLLCSCVSQLKINSAKGETRHWIVPELNTVAVSYIGDSLLKEGTASTSDALVLKDDYGKLGWTAFFNKGTYKFVGTASKRINHENQTVRVYQYGNPMPGVTGTIYAQLLETSDCDVYYNTNTLPMLNKDDYSKTTVVADVNDYYFEQQLIYTGTEGKIIKFTYREFADGTARPAFTIDATYDMSQDNVIRFKGAVLEIVSYNNQSIKYKVVSGFKK